MTLWEILKANKTGIAPDMFTMLAASKMNGGRDRLRELSGIPPLSFTAKGKPLTAWSITGNTVQNGTPTPENSVEVQAVGDRTANLFDSDSSEIAAIDITTGRDVAFYKSRRSDFILVEANDVITISGQNGDIRIFEYDTNKNYLDTNFIYDNSFSITNSGYIKFVGALESITETIMVNLGSTPLPYEPYGYKIPFTTAAEDGSESITTTVYLDKPLYSGEVMRSDGTITRSDGTTETFTAPQIPTLNGTTVIDVDTAVKPESIYIEYK